MKIGAFDGGQTFLDKFMWGCSAFFLVNLWGVFCMWELGIRLCQGGWEFHKCIFQKSENVSQPWWNILLKIKPRPFYRVAKGFILEVNNLKVSKNVSYAVSLVLTLTLGIDILFDRK